ncbi:carbohydrate ABC transporter permease [Oscillospiraceae bacterium LTW-04]|nr:carbohydrate ABC transporter permease [Oscillospiraceae bacterium MB24-C1]
MKESILSKATKSVVNILIILIFFTPFYWMMLTSIKNLGQTLKMPPVFWVENPQWQNFLTVFAKIPFFHMLKNSIIVAVGILICQCITVIPAAYAFARFRFKGDRFLFGVTLATMMIPAQLIFLPVFLMFSKAGMINSYASLILPSASSAFAIFMLRQSFKQVPEEILEAARLDNASEWDIMAKIMLPIVRPTVVTLALITFISTWNDYFWPLVLTTNNVVRTLPVGIAALRQSESGISYHILMAGNVLLVIPVMLAFFLAQKQIIKAFTYTGEK